MAIEPSEEHTGPIFMDQGAPVFPPLLKGHGVLAGTSAFDTAKDAVKRKDAGAGDLFWGVDARFLDVAIILEPDVVASKAAQMFYGLWPEESGTIEIGFKGDNEFPKDFIGQSTYGFRRRDK